MTVVSEGCLVAASNAVTPKGYNNYSAGILNMLTLKG